VGARFSSSVQTRPGADSASYTMGTVSFPRVNHPKRGVEHPPTSSAEIKERVELYIYSPSGRSWPVLGLTFTFTFNITILRGVFRPRQTRQLPRAVDLKERLLSCQSY